MHRKQLLLLTVWLLFFSGCQRQADERPPQLDKHQSQAMQVRLYEVREELIQRENEVVASLQAAQRATIAAKVTGTISRLPVELGSPVKKDDLLVQLRADEIAARLDQAQTIWEQAKRNLEQEQRLLRQDATSQEKVNTLQDAFRVAEAALEEAQTMYSYTTIKAPFPGRISSRYLLAGDLAVAGAPILLLENDQKLQVVGAVPEALLDQVQLGKDLLIKIPSLSFRVQGRIAEISPAAETSTRTVIVKIDIPSAPSLRPGQFARIVLPGGAATATLFIPTEAVQRFGQMERVFVRDKALATMRLVRTGARRDEMLEILGGLSPGDQVILNSADLHEGQKITVLP